MTPAVCPASCSCKQLGSKGRILDCIHGTRTCDNTHRGHCLAALPCFQTTQTQVRPGRDPPGSEGIEPSSVYFYTPPGCERGVNHRPLDFIQQKCRLTNRTHESHYALCRSHVSQSCGTFTNAHRIFSCAKPKSKLGIAEHHVNGFFSECRGEAGVRVITCELPIQENACELH